MNEISRNRFYLQASLGSIEWRGHGKGFVLRARFRCRRLSGPVDHACSSRTIPTRRNMHACSCVGAFAADSAHRSGDILTLFLSHSQIACVRARHQKRYRQSRQCVGPRRRDRLPTSFAFPNASSTASGALLRSRQHSRSHHSRRSRAGADANSLCQCRCAGPAYPTCGCRFPATVGNDTRLSRQSSCAGAAGRADPVGIEWRHG